VKGRGNLGRIIGHPLVKAAYFGLLIAATAFYLYRWGGHLPALLAQMRPEWAAAALAATAVAGLVYSYIQYALYRRLGVSISYWTTFRIINISQLGKYLPGRVMFVGNYYLLSREVGIGNAQIGASFVISQALWMLTACLCGLPMLTLLNPALRYTVLLMPLALVLLIHPRFLGFLLRLGQRLVGRAQGEPPPLPEGLGAAFYLGIAFLYLVNWGLAGLGAWFSLRAFGPTGLQALPLAMPAVAMGTVIGFVALFAPAGLGVREGLGAVILAPAVGGQVALLGLVLLRGLTVVVDLSFGGLGLLLKRRT